MKQYFRDRDGLGATPQMTYKKNETYGTTLGGCCSVCCRFFILFYVSLVIVGFFMTSNYEETTQTLYQSLQDPETYSVSSSDIIPTYQIVYNNGTEIVINDRNFYNVTYWLNSEDDEDSAEP